MCLCEEESNSHLFIYCSLALNLWSRILPVFGLSWVIPESYEALLSMSLDSHWPKASKILWKASMAATICVIWLERNTRIFRGVKCEPTALFNKITAQVIFWASNHKAFKGIPAASFLQDRENLLNLHTPRIGRANNFSPPPVGLVKLNFDGCSLGNLGPASAGGAFRDHGGNNLATFLEFLGNFDSQSAEPLALLMGLKLFNPVWGLPLVVEGDTLL
ncbi:hypothetical protein AMTRI_Chr05g67750 [Amborella trichopoda]